MIDAIRSLLLGVLGVIAGTAPSTVSAVAVALLAVALAAVLLSASSASGSAHRSLAHPRREIDVSVLLSQSDPDAAGHTRSRAPGSAAPAA